MQSNLSSTVSIKFWRNNAFKSFQKGVFLIFYILEQVPQIFCKQHISWRSLVHTVHHLYSSWASGRAVLISSSWPQLYNLPGSIKLSPNGSLEEPEHERLCPFHSDFQRVSTLSGSVLQTRVPRQTVTVVQNEQEVFELS
jgi:hypothetical protein